MCYNMADIIIDGTTIASKSGSTVSLQNINSGSFSSELTIPSGTTRPSNPSVGSIFYNSNIDKNRCEMYVGQDQWIPLWYRYHWMRPEKTSGYSGGTFSADGQVWFSENATKTNYGAVILNRVFPGDFTSNIGNPVLRGGLGLQANFPQHGSLDGTFNFLNDINEWD